MRRLTIIAALMPCLCAGALAQGWEDFPPYPATKELCHQRVYGNAREIHWASFTSGDSPQAVMAFYEGKLGKPETEPGVAHFRIKKDGAVERVLSVHAAAGSYPRCGKDPDAGDRTVLIVSRTITR